MRVALRSAPWLSGAAAVVAALLALVAPSSGSTAVRSYSATSLGTLGGDASTAHAISALGHVVGSSIAKDGRWHAFSWTRGATLVDLGAPGGPYVATFASDVNAAGQVIGVANTGSGNDPQRGFFWSQASGMLDLGTIGADTIVEPAAINASGHVAGTSWAAGAQTHAFGWTREGGIVDIGSLGGTGVVANDIDDGGEIVGMSGRGRVTPPGPHAFVWSASAGMRDLGTLGGAASEATAINQRGQIVGWSTTASGQTHAVLWSPAGMADLGTLGGPESRAVEISDNGQVIGTSTTAAGAEHAFSWTPATGIVDLGTLGGASSTPTGVSAAGQVVGFTTNASGVERPFVWEGGRMIDLGSLQAPQGRAIAINDRSQIVGYSHRGNGWYPGALLWTSASAKPVIGAPTATPSAPIAGRRFVVSFAVTRSDTGSPLTTGAMACDPTISGKAVAHAQSFKRGTARVAMTVPKGTKGKLLRVKVTIGLEGRPTTRVAAYRVV